MKTFIITKKLKNYKECKKNEYCSLENRCEHDCIMQIITASPKLDIISRAQMGWVYDGNINLDCNVNVFDLVILAKHFGCTPSSCSSDWIPITDLVKDDVINLPDFYQLKQQLGSTPNGC